MIVGSSLVCVRVHSAGVTGVRLTGKEQSYGRALVASVIIAHAFKNRAVVRAHNCPCSYSALEDAGSIKMNDTTAGVIIAFELTAIFWIALWRLAVG